MKHQIDNMALLLLDELMSLSNDLHSIAYGRSVRRALSDTCKRTFLDRADDEEGLEAHLSDALDMLAEDIIPKLRCAIQKFSPEPEREDMT